MYMTKTSNGTRWKLELGAAILLGMITTCFQVTLLSWPPEIKTLVIIFFLTVFIFLYLFIYVVIEFYILKEKLSTSK